MWSIARPQSLLVGEAASVETEAIIRDAIAATEGIEAVRDLRTIHVGPDDLAVVAGVWVDAATSATAISRSLDDARRRVGEVTPLRTVVSIEPHVRERSGDGEAALRDRRANE